MHKKTKQPTFEPQTIIMEKQENPKLTLSLEYTLEIATDEKGKEQILVSFKQSPENDLVAIAIANFHLTKFKEHNKELLEKTSDFQERKSISNNVTSLGKAINAITSIYNMMENQYLTYRKTVQLSAELVKLQKQATNGQTDQDTPQSDVPSEQ